MFEIVRILYKELHYQTLKRDPRLNEERKLKAFRRITVKSSLAKTSFFYLFFGSFLASGIAFTDSKMVISSLSVAIAGISFVFALYITVVNSSHSLSLALFEPLKVLPVKIGSLYLSELLLLNIIPILAIAIPTVLVMATKYPLSGVLLILWILTGVLIGHTIGLLILSIFGLRIGYRKTKGQFFKNLIRIIGLMVIMSAFYGLNYFFRYLSQYSEKFAEVFEKYSIAYPLSVSSIFDPEKSFILLVAYASVFLLLYRYSLNIVWAAIIEPKAIVGGRPENFTASLGGTIIAFAIKDLRLVFRKTSMVAGLLIPLYFILPQIFMIVRTGSFPKELAVGMLAIVSFLSTINAEILLRVEGREIDFLRILPIKKNQFIMGKAISMSALPVVFSIILICIELLFDRNAFILFPHALLMPFNVSLLTMIVLFHYKGEDIGIPRKGYLKTFLILGINGILVGAVTLPVLLIPFPKGFVISLCVAATAFGVMTGMLRK
jgi:hypothetical protein